MTEKIEHDGIVKDIVNNNIKVSILSKAACLSCSLKGVCSMSEVEEKEIDIPLNEAPNMKKGDNVTVFYEKKLGFLALFLGYILPFLLIMTILIVGKQLSYAEEVYGVASILVLIPYYLILYLFKDKLRNHFRFSIEKSKKELNFKIIN